MEDLYNRLLGLGCRDIKHRVKGSKERIGIIDWCDKGDRIVIRVTKSRWIEIIKKRSMDWVYNNVFIYMCVKGYCDSSKVWKYKGERMWFEKNYYNVCDDMIYTSIKYHIYTIKQYDTSIKKTRRVCILLLLANKHSLLKLSKDVFQIILGLIWDSRFDTKCWLRKKKKKNEKGSIYSF